MNREEMTLLGFEIVAYAGDARSKLLLQRLTILRQLCWLEKLLGRNFHTALP